MQTISKINCAMITAQQHIFAMGVWNVWGILRCYQPTSYRKFQLIPSTMTKQQRCRIDLLMCNMLLLLSLRNLLKRDAQEQSSQTTD